MIVWACIAPHGGELIPELADGNPHRMARTRGALERLGRHCRAEQPDTILVYTPHGICVDGFISISVSRYVIGELTGDNGANVSCRLPVDTQFAQDLSLQASQAGIPTIEAAYLPNGEPTDAFPLDWGSLVPLWFMGAQWEKPPAVVIVCPSRSLARRQLVSFGRVTAIAAEQSGKRIALICSADQGHGHSPAGPYGYSPTSRSYDAAYCRAVQQGDLRRLLHWRSDWIASAMPDSFWQTLMLHGAVVYGGLRGSLLSYEAPTYFGMVCAEFTI
ncbi:MAG: extradiol ring-cleavage dioxygenase [Chthonomonadales bacterium]